MWLYRLREGLRKDLDDLNCTPATDSWHRDRLEQQQEPPQQLQTK